MSRTGVQSLVTYADPAYIQPLDPAKLARLVRLSERPWQLLDGEAAELRSLALEAVAAHDRLLEQARSLMASGDAWRVEAERLAER